MPLYTVKVVDKKGVRIREEIEAQDINSLRDILRQKDLLPVEIKEASRKAVPFLPLYAR
jgi:type II secretory pathway component PulF